MQFSTVISALTLSAVAVFAQETVVSDGVTYVDVTETPEVTVSAVSTELSTSTPYSTTTLAVATLETYAGDNSTSTEHTVEPYSGAALKQEVLGSSLVGVVALVAALL
ncbi:Tos6 [Kluyveromyces lactis]|uniref:Protein TOS6 n=1 Tax=Kluyveromyces lactis (strain ATCC 8585 / CBS 2359 / DSM 70799 / NBRC 1267 / NRRL Y-1140 / WM37) TaxID=284590 RepID=TOS6_KLULA|nr:uncharacterized protein KLLA0_A07315g [Kluyveromyces lactis]Q6CXL4.1 RecName: Full=Protein TOS6; Flags: Precursor [Kluyveromyces lactis NRRL Y-1140]QEU58548.1 Tos6 [Kluyveromyces lactis]CAH02913.1 KLLA0A07315p [Kluyveromyces lactis]|eukprot:XP_451325.1 uncharacterized protein KLLA0_A07315g [Kluyveromyces lactis]